MGGAKALLHTTFDTLRAMDQNTRNAIMHSDSGGTDLDGGHGSALESEIEGNCSSEDHEDLQSNVHRQLR